MGLGASPRPQGHPGLSQGETGWPWAPCWGRAPPVPHIFLFTPRIRLDCTSEMRNWMSCGQKGTVSLALRGAHQAPPRPAAHLVDDFLLLGVLLPQAGHFPPQGLVLAVTQWAWSAVLGALHRIPPPPPSRPGQAWGLGCGGNRAGGRPPGRTRRGVSVVGAGAEHRTGCVGWTPGYWLRPPGHP